MQETFRIGDPVVVVATNEDYGFIDGWKGFLKGWEQGCAVVEFERPDATMQMYIPPHLLILNLRGSA